MAITFFQKSMPWEAPFVKVGKGASSGDAVREFCYKKLVKAGRGILLRKFCSKVWQKYLAKTKPRKPGVKKVPKLKPRIDGLQNCHSFPSWQDGKRKEGSGSSVHFH